MTVTELIEILEVSLWNKSHEVDRLGKDHYVAKQSAAYRHAIEAIKILDEMAIGDRSYGNWATARANDWIKSLEAK